MSFLELTSVYRRDKKTILGKFPKAKIVSL